MTDRIPEEIMQAAMRVACDTECTTRDGNLRIIADALLRERQRAAEIARHVPTPADVQDPMLRLGYISASQAIADAILSYDEAQQ